VRRALAVLALAVLAGCGEEEPHTELRACGGSPDNVIMTTEATTDVQCSEALAFADFVAGYTITPSPCFRGGEYGGAVVSPCDAGGWSCELSRGLGHGRGVIDCTDDDRGRRLRLTSFYALDERPESWDANFKAFDADDHETAYRRLHLTCRESTLAELADAYETAEDRDAVLEVVAGFTDDDSAAQGCQDGFRARDLLGRTIPGYLDSTE
jgi:hypothetical protein